MCKAGGIFFDDICSIPLDKAFELLISCGNAVSDAYFPIVKRRMNMPFTEEQKHWQQLRRGRYVEFNLLWGMPTLVSLITFHHHSRIDRGTKFGIRTPNARIESILMSLPLTSRWEYMNVPKEGSEEDKLVKVLQEARDWI
jgi:coproporphyrinogen III oxidase